MPDEGSASETPPLVVYTVGHSNVALEALLALLARHEIRLLADVRSAPYSRYVPHFNRPVTGVGQIRERLALSRELEAGALVSISG